MAKLGPMGCEQKWCLFIFIKMKLLALIFFSPTSWKMEMIGKIPWIPTEMLRIAELLTSQRSYVSSGNRAALQAVGIVSYKNEINSYPI